MNCPLVFIILPTNAESVTHAAIQASEIALEGNQTIKTTVNQMNAINLTVDGLAQAVKGLGERSQEIGHIIRSDHRHRDTDELACFECSD